MKRCLETCFLSIRKLIKVVFDNDITNEEEKDRIWKIQPLVDRILQGCMAQPREQETCMDEMMIPFTGQCYLKQYVPNMPNPVGLKVFWWLTLKSLFVILLSISVRVYLGTGWTKMLYFKLKSYLYFKNHCAAVTDFYRSRGSSYHVTEF